jgi:hypothetical protein
VTFSEAVQIIYDNIDPIELGKTRELALVNDLVDMAGSVHYTIGQGIRNTFKLWTPEAAELRKSTWDATPDVRKGWYDRWWEEAKLVHRGETMHPDDVSNELIIAVLEKIKNTPG